MRELKIMLLVWTALCLIGFASAAAIPVSIEKVSIDGTTLSASAPNRLNIERGQEFQVKITLLAEADAENVQVEAFISGYEYSDFEPISDATPVFDVEEGVLYVKKLKLHLPENVDEDNYKLRIYVSDRYSEGLVQDYNLKIDAPRHYVKIKDVWFTPENVVYAGEYLIASLRLKNYGDKDEEGIKVEVAIPDLGVSATDYIDELEAGDSVSSEELYLKLPKCNVDAGVYNVVVSAVYDDGHESAKYTAQINVETDGICEGEAPEEVGAKLIVNIEAISKELVAGGQGATYPITITNTGDKATTLVLSLPQVAWGSLRVSPSNVVVLQGGETKTVYVYATANKETTTGSYQFTLGLEDTEGNTLKEVTFEGKVSQAQTGGVSTQVVRGLEIALVVLILILVVIGLVIGLRKLRGGAAESEEEVSGETYY